ncbi:sortase domain-containing protein [Planococcus sp. YIM B11945]|uniref:class F sortase n=1 Tax=Planococcus sp. YIM B11945 TaxID=3435410 RepID=UPI003D7E7121
MKQFLTMGIALFLCATLFFILKPLANNSTAEKSTQSTETREVKSSGDAADKIAEFPILPKQREKLEEIQRQRQQSIRGMEPVHIEIPSIEVDAAIQPTGVLENGEMGVPDAIEEVGWFEPGFLAGALGHAVLAGHVDSKTGPAVFYELKNVKIGDQVELTDATGRKMVFEVKKVTSYATDKAPIEEIFGKSQQRMINLITCTGNFNRDIGSHEERLVVSAELVSDTDLKEAIPEAPTNVALTAYSISWHAVRDDAIIGYRIYEQDLKSGKTTKLQTVSLFDRKQVEITTEPDKRYFVSSVDVGLNESEKMEAN